MLHLITAHDPLYCRLSDDPVRPHIPNYLRVSGNREVWALVHDSQPLAITCVAYCDNIPATEDDLFHSGNTVAVFYTIWSYSRGFGRQLILDTLSTLKKRHNNVRDWVTLSPPGEMARKFHLQNGATVYRDCGTTVNYRYEIA